MPGGEAVRQASPDGLRRAGLRSMITSWPAAGDGPATTRETPKVGVARRWLLAFLGLVLFLLGPLEIPFRPLSSVLSFSLYRRELRTRAGELGVQAYISLRTSLVHSLSFGIQKELLSSIIAFPFLNDLVFICSPAPGTVTKSMELTGDLHERLYRQVAGSPAAHKVVVPAPT